MELSETSFTSNQATGFDISMHVTCTVAGYINQPDNVYWVWTPANANGNAAQNLDEFSGNLSSGSQMQRKLTIPKEVYKEYGLDWDTQTSKGTFACHVEYTTGDSYGHNGSNPISTETITAFKSCKLIRGENEKA